MSAIIYSQIKIPKSCAACENGKYGLILCPMNTRVQLDEFRRKDLVCPITVLQKHGRLVDADRLRVILCRMKESYLPELDEAAWAIGWAIEVLDKLETVVEGEE